MTATADEVWAEDVLRVYGTNLYPAALRMTAIPRTAGGFLLARGRAPQVSDRTG
jgi:hypothetical protein